MLLNGLSAAIMETSFLLGADYDVVTVTVDPMETTDLASGKRTTYLKALDKLGIDKARWRFFTAPKTTIEILTEQTGFVYEYDPDTLQYIHPSVLIFIGPDRTLTRYLYGSYFQPENFEHALVESGDGAVGTVTQQWITWLHDFGRPEIGRRYALNKSRVAALLVGIIGFGLVLVWLGLRRATPPTG
jgi:protein SCO1